MSKTLPSSHAASSASVAAEVLRRRISSSTARPHMLRPQALSTDDSRFTLTTCDQAERVRRRQILQQFGDDGGTEALNGSEPQRHADMSVTLKYSGFKQVSRTETSLFQSQIFLCW